jgi:hypothetical protein
MSGPSSYPGSNQRLAASARIIAVATASGGRVGAAATKASCAATNAAFRSGEAFRSQYSSVSAARPGESSGTAQIAMTWLTCRG